MKNSLANELPKMPVISQHLAASKVQTYTKSKILGSKATQPNLDFCLSLSLLPSSFTFSMFFPLLGIGRACRILGLDERKVDR